MSGINESRQATEIYKKEYGSSGSSSFLRTREGDVVLCYFVGSGDPGDPFFEPYVAHEIPPESAEKMRQYWYCPAMSKHHIPEGYLCKWCGTNVKAKRRMYMWFYVQSILHRQLLQGEQFPQVEWRGMSYFREDINAFKRWDTSAWEESPLEDIFMMHMQFGSLRTQRTLLMCTGTGLKRRYKIAGEPNTPALPDQYVKKAIEECEPILSILQGKLQRETDAEPVIRPLDDSPTMGLPSFGGLADPSAAQTGGFSTPTPANGGAPAGFGDLPPRGEPLF